MGWSKPHELGMTGSEHFLFLLDFLKRRRDGSILCEEILKEYFFFHTLMMDTSLQDFVTKVSSEFAAKDLGSLHYFLGIRHIFIIHMWSQISETMLEFLVHTPTVTNARPAGQKHDYNVVTMSRSSVGAPLTGSVPIPRRPPSRQATDAWEDAGTLVRRMVEFSALFSCTLFSHGTRKKLSTPSELNASPTA